MNGYVGVLFLHSWLRWLILVLLLLSLGVSLRGLSTRAPWTPGKQRLHRALIAAVDMQLFLGLALWLLFSPLATAFRADLGAGLHDHVIRFFGLEHPTMMIVAVASLHIGWDLTRKAQESRQKHRRAALSVLLALLCVGSSIPWPGLRHERPLIRTL
ncbi:MAG: hypothetical protein U1E65_35535 [Myxococcota bacterium]